MFSLMAGNSIAVTYTRSTYIRVCVHNKTNTYVYMSTYICMLIGGWHVVGVHDTAIGYSSTPRFNWIKMRQQRGGTLEFVMSITSPSAHCLAALSVTTNVQILSASTVKQPAANKNSSCKIHLGLSVVGWTITTGRLLLLICYFCYFSNFFYVVKMHFIWFIPFFNAFIKCFNFKILKPIARAA